MMHTRKHRRKSSDRLCRAFPELDIEYDVEPVESEGYPIYRISSKRNRLMPCQRLRKRRISKGRENFSRCLFPIMQKHGWKYGRLKPQSGLRFSGISKNKSIFQRVFWLSFFFAIFQNYILGMNLIYRVERREN